MISAFWPIWALAAAGYLARRLGLLGAKASAALGWYVFHLAVPAALFVTLARTKFAGFDVKPLIAFALGTALVMSTGWYAARRLFDRQPSEQPIWSMAAGYGNSANLGIPVALRLLGSVSFLVQVLLLQVLIIGPIILTMLDRHADAAGRIRLRRIATIPFRNPVILGSALGVGTALAGLAVPTAVLKPLTLLSATAVPAALVALGASLRQDDDPAAGTPASEPKASRAERPCASEPKASRARASRRGAVPPGRQSEVRATSPDGTLKTPRRRAGKGAELGMIAALKLVGQPAVALAAGALLHLTSAELLAVVVCAGLPSAQNTFVFASGYGVAVPLASRAVLVTTTLSMASLIAWAALLGG